MLLYHIKVFTQNDATKVVNTNYNSNNVKER